MRKSEIRLVVWHKFGCKCAYCGVDIEFKAMQVDHVIPKIEFQNCIRNRKWIPSFLLHLTESDVDHIDNLFPACRVCNKWKSMHSLEHFRKEISEQIKRLNDYSSNFRMAKKYNQIKETPSVIVFYFEAYKQVTPTHP